MYRVEFSAFVLDHPPEFRSEVLKLAERIGVAVAARELSLYESHFYNWRSKQQSQTTSFDSTERRNRKYGGV
ncbi:hypothetical protein OLZ31_20605 [Enterobacter asburiae]|nr:hypothetical protein [Enterobacter asburiae]